MAELTRSELNQKITDLDPYEFEAFVAEVWAQQGYETEVKSGSGDRGIDIEAKKSTPVEQRVLIQAKQYSEENRIGSELVRKYATLYQQESNADSIVIVTTSEFTSEAKTVAREQNVKLVDLDSLINLIKNDIRQYSIFSENSITSISGGDFDSKSVYSTKKSQSERIEDLRNALERALNEDKSLSGSRGRAYVRWKDPDNCIFIVNVRYKKLGSLFSRYFGAEIEFHQHPKEEHNPTQWTEILSNIDGIHKTRNHGTTRLYTKKDEDSDIELEYDIVREIIQRTGADLSDISNVDNPVM